MVEEVPVVPGVPVLGVPAVPGLVPGVLSLVPGVLSLVPVVLSLVPVVLSLVPVVLSSVPVVLSSVLVVLSLKIPDPVNRVCLVQVVVRGVEDPPNVRGSLSVGNGKRVEREGSG